MKAFGARMIFHLLSLPNRQIYAHVLIYLELSVSPLHSGVKIVLMRNAAGIVIFSCNNMAKKQKIKDFFLLTPLFQRPLMEINSIFFLPPSLLEISKTKLHKKSYDFYLGIANLHQGVLPTLPLIMILL